MSPEVLDWVARCLEEDEDVIVPLRKIWAWRYNRAGELHFQRFAQAVLNDARFEVVYAVNCDIDMESLGCFSGPRVKLRNRLLTAQSVLSLARKQNERVVAVLIGALEALRSDPDNSQNRELEDAITMLQDLQPALRRWTHFTRGGGLDRAG